MKLGDLTFPIDDWNQLSYPDLLDLKGFLEAGLASPFWLAYREIVEGNLKGFERQVLYPAGVGLDSSFEVERSRGMLLATKVLSESMQTLLDDVMAEISDRQAKGNFDERRTSGQQPTDDERPIDQPNASP